MYTWVELLTDWIQTNKNFVHLRLFLPPGFARYDELKQSLIFFPAIIAELPRMSDFG